MFSLAGKQTCQLFENVLMATCKWAKETHSDDIAKTLSAEHFNLKRYSV